MRIAPTELVFLIILTALTLVSVRITRASPHDRPGTFSRNATEVWGWTGPSKSLTIKSPNGQNAVIVEYHSQSSPSPENATVYLEIGGRRLRTKIGQLVNSEVQWSPDSKALAVTFSDGGDVGTYHTRIYWIENQAFRVQEPTAGVKQAYLSHKLVCFQAEPPNIGAIEWLGSSQQILLAAEIPPHSNCDNFGTFKAYQVQLPGGRIVKVYGQIEARRLFGPHLGAELANADDTCITKPGSCDIPQLHSHGMARAR